MGCFHNELAYTQVRGSWVLNLAPSLGGISTLDLKHKLKYATASPQEPVYYIGESN